MNNRESPATYTFSIFYIILSFTDESLEDSKSKIETVLILPKGLALDNQIVLY